MYACLESVVLRLGQVLHLIIEACASQRLVRDVASVNKSSDGNVKSILVASGTALEQNTLWRRMLADCLSVGVIVDSNSAEEATSCWLRRCSRRVKEVHKKQHTAMSSSW